MLSEEDKYEIRSIVLQELAQVLTAVNQGRGGYGDTDASAKAQVIARPIYNVIVERLRDMQIDREQASGK